MNLYFLVEDISIIGGAERVVVNLANNFSEDYNVKIITKKMEKQIIYKMKPTIEIINLNIDNKNKILKNIQLIKKLNEIFNNKNSVEIIIGIGVINSIPLYFIRNTKIKKIASEHMSYHMCNKIVKVLRKLIYPRLSSVVSLTNYDLKKYYEKMNRNSICIPNFSNFELKTENIKKENIMISVGRLDNQKGFDRLIEIWKEFEKINKEWQLEIYGEGPLKKELQNKIDVNRLKNIKLMGSTDKIQEKIEKSKLYLMTSRYEGLPMVLIEAMTLGVPCISFDCKTGPRDIIKNGENGFLIEDGNNELYLKKIIECTTNDEYIKEMSVNSKELVKKFSKAQIIELWKEHLKIISKDYRKSDFRC